MTDNNIVSYSYMAALLSRGDNLYNYVYLPLAKKAISDLASKGALSVTPEELAEKMRDLYELLIPIEIAKKLIHLVYKTTSRKQKKKNLFSFDDNKNAITFSSYSYTETESTYNQERRNVNCLKDKFDHFMKEEYPEVPDYPSFSLFIDKYKRELSGFFSGKDLSLGSDAGNSYLPHVQFLQSIEKKDDKLYKTARNIYLGTLMATFLEDAIDLDIKIKERTYYYFDTQLILEALDLQDKSRTKAARDIISLIQKSGGIVAILDVTLQEVSNILRKATYDFNHESADQIVAACRREKHDLHWLNDLSAHLEPKLKEFKISKVSISESEKTRFLQSDEYQKLSGIWRNKGMAKHDTIAYLYVRSRRSATVNSFQKAGYWFVTANEVLYDFNKEIKKGLGLMEITTPGYLTGMLFVLNPSKLSGKVSHIILSESIAQTIQEETPSVEMIDQFYETLKGINALDEKDYSFLREALAEKSNKELKKILADQDNIIHTTRQIINDHKEKEDRRRHLEEKSKRDTIVIRSLTSIIILIITISVILIGRNYQWLTTGLIATVSFIAVVLIAIAWLWQSFKSWTKKLIYGIAGLGGFWGFCNFIINLIKAKGDSSSIQQVLDFLKDLFAQ